ncbi:MAG: VOC family protein [Acidobacteria bacterium]|nr:VOC family protein [Acidobacteriota bacterium]
MNPERIQQNAFPLGWLLIALIAIFALFASARGQVVSYVESVGFTVSDMDKAVEFYTRVLPFEKISDVEVWGSELEHLSGVFGARVRIVRLRLGGETLELTEYLTPQGRPIPVDSKSNDCWFQHIAIIVSDMDKAYAMLRANKVRHASTGPQTLPAYITAAAGIKAFYFKDFDNHVLEILQFPDGKGARKWHNLEKTGKLFLGIDHTAIVVSDSDTSLNFYRDRLGLAVAGSSDNYGPEQEHLNNVFGAKLHITGLRTKDDGIAVEFLEYKAPTDGRPYPKDSRSNDIWHWQTSFAAPGLAQVLSGYRAEYISSGSVLFNNSRLGFRKAALIRDPDGHAVRLTER